MVPLIGFTFARACVCVCVSYISRPAHSLLVCASALSLLCQWVDVLERAVLKAEKMGFLYRKDTAMGGMSSSWRSRWFVLQGHQLLMYTDKAHQRPKETLSLLKASGIEELPYDVSWQQEGAKLPPITFRRCWF